MTINHVYKIINKVMKLIDNVDMMNLNKQKREYNQKQLNETYKILDNFKDELIRENIKNKQRRSKWQESF